MKFMRRRMFSILAALVLAMGMATTTAVYAEDSTTQTKTFGSKEEAQSWIDSFDTSKYEVKGDIQENEVSGVTTSIDTEKDPEGKGYYIDFDSDKRIAQVHITGGVESISIDLPYTNENALPGDNFTWSFDFINDSQDTYVNGGWNHVDSGLGGNAVDHIKRLGKFDPTYKWILQKYGSDPYLDTFDESNAYNYDVQVVESSAIPEGITVVEVETKPVANEMTFNEGPYYHDTVADEYYVITQTENPRYKGNVNEANVLAYYNSQLGTNYTSLQEAWNAYFYAKCWSLSYTTLLNEVTVNSDQATNVIVKGELDFDNADNMYQDTDFGWSDIVTFNCPKKVEYVATVTLKEKPQAPKDEKKDKEDKKNDDVKTSASTNANVFVSLGVASIAGVGVLALLKQKQKNK